MPLKFKKMMTVIFLVITNCFFHKSVLAMTENKEFFAVEATKNQMCILLNNAKTLQTKKTVNFYQREKSKESICNNAYALCENFLNKNAYNFNQQELQKIDYDFYNFIEKLYSFRFYDLDAKFDIFISLFNTNSLDLT